MSEKEKLAKKLDIIIEKLSSVVDDLEDYYEELYPDE